MNDIDTRMRSPAWAAIALMALGAALAACGDPTEVAGGEPFLWWDEADHPAGVEVVEVSAELLEGLPRWSFAAEPEVVIGEIEGDAERLFFRVNAARLLDSGEILIVDGQTLELRVFGADGGFRRAFGGRGEGPGEFGGFPLRVSASDGMRVWIHDVPLGRITEMNLETGEFETRPLRLECQGAGGGEGGPCSLAAILPGGTVMASRPAATSTAPRPSATSDRLTRRPGAMRYYGLPGEAGLRVLDSIPGATGVTIGYGSDFFAGEALFEPGGAVAFGPGTMVLGNPYRFELRIWSQEGVLRRIVRGQAPPAPVTRELLDRYRRWADTASNLPAVTSEYLAGMRPEGVVPLFSGLRVDRVGRIWVEDYRPFWAFGPRGSAAWTVFDPEGLPLARIEGGAPGAILEIGEDYVLVNARTEYEVERVMMYRLERGGG